MSSKEKPSYLPGLIRVDEEAVLRDTHVYRESSHTSQHTYGHTRVNSHFPCCKLTSHACAMVDLPIYQASASV